MKLKLIIITLLVMSAGILYGVDPNTQTRASQTELKLKYRFECDELLAQQNALQTNIAHLKLMLETTRGRSKQADKNIENELNKLEQELAATTAKIEKSCPIK